MLDDAVLHDHNPVTHGHGLGLVVGNIDNGGLEAIVQLAELSSHLHTQLSVEVGQRFVHQEHLWFTHNGTANSNTLTLTTGKRLRLAVEQILDTQHLRGFLYTLVNLMLGEFAQLQAERHVVVHVHVGIESVVLEHHGDVPIFWRNVVYHGITDGNGTFTDFLQAGYHPQGGGFSTSRRADQDDKLLILDVQTDVVHGNHVAKALCNIFQQYLCQR